MHKAAAETTARVVAGGGGGGIGSRKGKAEALLGVGRWVCFRLGGVVIMKGRGGAGGRRGVMVVVEVVGVTVGTFVVVVGEEV